MNGRIGRWAMIGLASALSMAWAHGDPASGQPTTVVTCVSECRSLSRLVEIDGVTTFDPADLHVAGLAGGAGLVGIWPYQAGQHAALVNLVGAPYGPDQVSLLPGSRSLRESASHVTLTAGTWWVVALAGGQVSTVEVGPGPVVAAPPVTAAASRDGTLSVTLPFDAQELGADPGLPGPFQMSGRSGTTTLQKSLRIPNDGTQDGSIDERLVAAAWVAHEPFASDGDVRGVNPAPLAATCAGTSAAACDSPAALEYWPGVGLGAAVGGVSAAAATGGQGAAAAWQAPSNVTSGGRFAATLIVFPFLTPGDLIQNE